MGDFDQTYIEDSSDSSDSRGVTITANASPNTKGAYTELFASTSSAAVMLRLTFIPEVTNITECLIDIATGAAASEVNIIENIKYYCDSAESQDIPETVSILVPIPSGSRLSARIQASTGSDTIDLIATIYSGTFTFDGFTSDTLGADTSNSRGSLIPDPGGSANTLGAYTEVVASSANAITHMIISFGSNANVGMNNADWLYQISTGAASSEVVVHGGIFVSANTAENVMPILVIVPLIIPASTRIAIRCQCSITNAVDRLLDVSVIGLGSSVTAAGGGGGGLLIHPGMTGGING